MQKLKERYLEENFFKKIDRALHAEDYAKLKDELQMHRATKRLLEPEVENLRMQYASVKNSPQGADVKFELNQKLKDQRDADERLEIYKDLGRKGLGVSPTEYKVGKARGQGLKIGGLGGLGLGALGATALQTLGENASLEEGFLDKTKDFVGNNKPLVAGLGGAGLGALYNYATDGTDDLARERTEDLENFRKGEAADQIAADQMPTNKETHMSMSDKISNLKNPSLFQHFKNTMWDSNIRNGNELLDIRNENPELTRNINNPNEGHGQKYAASNPVGAALTNITKEDMPRDYGYISNYEVNSNLNPSQNWEQHLSQKADAIRSNDTAINRGINSDPELVKKQESFINNLGDSKLDSYRNTALGGAALGAGGTYAVRKLKEKQGY